MHASNEYRTFFLKALVQPKTKQLGAFNYEIKEVESVRVKPVVTVLLIITTATIICSSVRADVIPPPSPQSLLLELKETVQDAPDWVFKGYVVTFTRQQKNALANKIDVTIGLYDITEHDEAADKLRDDIAPKLRDPSDGDPPGRARSWLQLYPEDCDEWRAVRSFAAQCQEIIGSILAPNG